MRFIIPSIKNLITGFLAVVMVAWPREYLKGLLAHKLGDPTPKKAGRLTFNPFVHLDPIGTVSFVLFEFGWSRPVPIRYWKLRKGKKDLLKISLLGPFISVCLFLFFGVLAREFPEGSFGRFFLLKVAKYNLTYALFSLFPIPPLDGSKILVALLPEKYTGWYVKYEVYGILFLLALLVLWIMPLVMNPFVEVINDLVDAIAR